MLDESSSTRSSSDILSASFSGTSISISSSSSSSSRKLEAVQLPPERLPTEDRDAGADGAGPAHDPAESWYTNLWGSVTTAPADEIAEADQNQDGDAPPPMVPAEDQHPEAEGE